TVTTATGNDGGPGGSTANMNAGVYGSATSGAVTKVRRIVYGAYGSSPTAGSVMIEPHVDNIAQFPVVYNSTTKTLVDSGSGADFPAAADVRAGVVYNVGNMTGTLAVPTAANVTIGVPVDATVGTAVLTATAVASQLEATLGATTRAEPTGVPAANAPFADKLNWLYAFFRNKRVVGATGATLRNADDTDDIGAASMDDTNGVFTQDGWQ
ncbi:MAG: hypothetical protein LC131_06500, partial [Anaerolineae bacterium]|nr:hypothetical protein [Anaerolineae bacterium]